MSVEEQGAIVRTTDLRDGTFEEICLAPDNYVVVCGPKRYIAHEQVFDNGTVVLTIKSVEST